MTHISNLFTIPWKVAMKTNPEDFQYLALDVVKAAVVHDGMYLEHASDAMKADIDVVRVAVAHIARFVALKVPQNIIKL